MCDHTPIPGAFDTQTNPSTAGRGPVTTEQKILETGASLVQEFLPTSNICAFLNAFHVYASDPSRAVEAQHYCAHVSSDVRQCIIYDSPLPNARLIGVEYMITPELYATLDSEERKLWHSHVFEVKSGMLIMPRPKGSLMPEMLWEKAETQEMREVVGLYGKTWHLWQVDRGDTLPLGRPMLMQSLLNETEGFKKLVKDRDERFGTDRERKRELRKDIRSPEVHEDADQWDHSKQV
ncbi:hypothetical protein BZA05DRAFT_395407 [Tricharina praecox]|uniref:uncharacterized protein n=1 Tax=Tricharina praecox TaxID=43433 RepID=UPI002220AC40|nr:uncharacterized protein BZA05DRAFT_395407 [Tricharina praecox]KAI5854015.1 hypothetical protein BZA05DRAFT_395407 [Tricharina praecox]